MDQIRLAKAVLAVAALIGAALLAGPGGSIADAQTRRARATPTPRPPARYTQFPHDSKSHKIECSNCHKFPSSNWNKVRTGDDAFPDITEYPNHDSCIRCHQQQFFRGARPPICTICHTDPSPRNSTRHPFPNPREIFDKSPKGKSAVSDFVIGFPHDKHIEIVAGHRSPRPRFIGASYAASLRSPAEESCKVCHQTVSPQGDGEEEFLVKPPASAGDGFWLKKGTFKSVPLGHSSCFTCHSDDSGIAPAPKDCAACHTLRPAGVSVDLDLKLAEQMIRDDKPMLDLWRTRHSSGTFRHEWFSHAEMTCGSCHNVEKMNTADPRTTRVTMDSCATCHATATVDDGGALNYEIAERAKNARFECTKCHVVFGRQAIPASHHAAVKSAGGK